MDQVLHDNKIIDLVYFSLPQEHQKEILFQVFDSDANGINKLVEFFD